MAIPNPEHLFEQADELIVRSSAGAPRQVDLRRAISAAYYGLFHSIMTHLADEFVGVKQRSSPAYTLFYRTVDHRRLRDICSELKKQTPAQKYAGYVPGQGWGLLLYAVAVAVVDLQDRRHVADYDPRPRFNASDAKLAIQTARRAVGRFAGAAKEERRTFLALLVCPPR